MKVKMKSGSFGPVFVDIDNEGQMLFGDQSGLSGSLHVDMSSPALTLLYSLGSCVAISIQNVAKSKKVSIRPFRVEISGTKADDLPSRFGKIIVKVDDQLLDDKKLGAEICAQAKKICTISNTLNAEVILQFN